MERITSESCYFEICECIQERLRPVMLQRYGRSKLTSLPVLQPTKC